MCIEEKQGDISHIIRLALNTTVTWKFKEKWTFGHHRRGRLLPGTPLFMLEYVYCFEGDCGRMGDPCESPFDVRLDIFILYEPKSPFSENIQFQCFF